MRNIFKTVYCEDCEYVISGIDGIAPLSKCRAKPIKKKYTYRLQKPEYEYCCTRLHSFCFKFKEKTK